MAIWKLGCRWGKNYPPLFYELIRANEIVITTDDKVYQVNDWILIADGQTILAFAKVLEHPWPVTNNPLYKQSFSDHKIPFNDTIFIAKAAWIVLENQDQFKYELQQGICKVHNDAIILKFNALLSQYLLSEKLTSMKNLLRYKNQIILQGPPGTGKTYTAKNIAEQMIFSEISADKNIQKSRLENTDQFKLIQFHPAYSYEDFVRGITAKSKDGIVEYITENKIFAKFAKKALKNFSDSSKEQLDVSKEKWVTEQFEKFTDFISDGLEKNGKIVITDAVSIVKLDEDAFRYKGVEGWSKNGNRMLYDDIVQSYIDENNDRQDVKHNQNLSGLAKWHASYYIRVLELFRKFLTEKGLVFQPTSTEKIELKNFVLVIDEINRANLPSVLGELIYALEYRGEKVESMYDIEGVNTLVIPRNLYIIGTMNTADRSVGHIDYAVRRRFAFVDILPDATVIENESAKTLFDEISKLFHSKDTLASDFKAAQVQLGHSYFIVKDDTELKLKAKYEIVPILEEYLKDGVLLEKAEKIILDLKQRFDN